MARRIFVVTSVVATGMILGVGYFTADALWAFALVGPLMALGVRDMVQSRHTLLRIYPVVGHGRYLMEAFRPEIQQYFVENNTDGAPFSRELRSVVYQRAKGERDTVPFGTQRNLNQVGVEWLQHSILPKPVLPAEPRVRIGVAHCQQPYEASHLNISAMSYGSLSRTAITALSRGAQLGGFYHNTGEGGLSPYHLEGGGDLVWQIGTGYFGCRSRTGHFEPNKFAERASHERVKMIEIKISQGAKPGHGGILPAAKVTPEIAAIRDVPVGETVISPPGHSAFSTPLELLEFVARLRELSGGKPVGFKLCVGYRAELIAIAKAMLRTGIAPDFITVDGSEGGTGAAPLELSNSVGMPLREGLLTVHNILTGFDLRERVKVVASGKIVTGFHILRAKALGADICNSARGMMFALGCIQARRCNSNDCPVGVATQDPGRYRALHVPSKAERVMRYHEQTIHSFLELTASAGLGSPDDIQPHHISRRTSLNTTSTYDRLYEYLPVGVLLERESVPGAWFDAWDRASAEHF